MNQPVLHPGEHFQNELIKRQWSHRDFSIRSGFSPGYVSQFFRQQVGVSKKLAQALGEVLGPSAEYWLDLQKQYITYLNENNRPAGL